MKTEYGGSQSRKLGMLEEASIRPPINGAKLDPYSKDERPHEERLSLACLLFVISSHLTG